MSVGSTEQFTTKGLIRSPITAIASGSVLSCGSSNITSSTFSSEGFRRALAYLQISDTGSTGAATTVQFIPQFTNSTLGSTGKWFNYAEGVWASMVFSAVQIQSTTFFRSHSLTLDGRRTRFAIERNTTRDDINFTVSVSLEAMN